MKKLIKFLLIGLVWVVIAAVLIVGALALDEPVSTALVILGILFGAWILFLLIRKFLVRHRARKRAQKLVNVEQAETTDADTPWWQTLFARTPKAPLERRFRSLVRLLTSSRLSEQGDPLYVLPWYLLIGDRDTGKTDLVANAGLSRPTLDDAALRSDGDSLDWWLYNEAIVLDAPGSYIGADEDAPQHRDWPALLRILAEGRSREPLNGIVVTVSYDQLEGDADQLYDYGRRLRKRIDALMRRTKLQLPIYVVITKCDQMSGFTAWCSNLPSDALGQPMGMLNTSQRHDGESVKRFLREAITRTSARIGRLMLVLFNDRGPDPDLLRLPRSVDALADPLSAFADGLFQATTFEESPRLEGLYFTGRQREGEDSPQAFARELFTKVLPANRSVRSTLSGAERAERTTRRLVLSGWGLAVIAVLAVLVGSWVADKTYLTNTAQQYAGAFGHVASLPKRIDRMHRLQTMVTGVKQETADWLMPWFGMPGMQQPDFVGDLQQTYYQRATQQVIKPLDHRFDEALAARKKQIQSGKLPKDQVAFFISSLIERINILAAYADGTRGAALGNYPGPYDNSGIFFDQTVDPLTIKRANAVFIQALLWAPDPSQARARLDQRRKQLVWILKSSGNKLSWLIPWANDRLPNAGYRLSDFWDGSASVNNPPVIEAAFTTSGYTATQQFLTQIKSSGIDPKRFKRLKAQFQKYYRAQYLKAWRSFAMHFHRGTKLLSGYDDWHEAVISMATPRNPYFKLLSVMYNNLSPFNPDDLPDWAKLVRYYDEMRSFSPSQPVDNSARNRVFAKLGLKFLKKTGPLGKSLAKSGKRGLKTRKKLNRANSSSGSSPSQRKLQLQQAGKILAQYRDLLSKIAFKSDIRSVSETAAANLFSHPDNPGKGKGPSAQAHQKMRELQAIVGAVTRYNKPFWSVFTGPLDVISQYHVHEASCYVQQQWRDQFLTKLVGVPKTQLPQYIFGKGQILQKFMTNNLAPFIQQRLGAGYVPTTANGDYLHFTDGFLHYATVGYRAMNAPTKRHSVRVKALPTGGNAGAVYQPGRTELDLNCDSGSQRLVNFNYPTSKVFNWTPTCHGATMKIKVGRHTITKKWPGTNGFAHFLKTFQSGTKRYRPSDFPEQQAILEDYGVKYINVSYQLSGAEPLIKMINRLPTTPPQQIAACWN